LASLLKSLLRLASVAPLMCFTFDHLLCPDIGFDSGDNGNRSEKE
jgi:hypothetical protein